MYVKITENQSLKFPYTLLDLQKENPNTSFPSPIDDNTLNKYNVFKVKEVEPPDIDSKTHQTNLEIEFVDNEWTQKWSIQELSYEIASFNIRAFRNFKLQETDWTQLADAPVNSSEWANYRQELRDISKQEGFPWNVNWPTNPT